MGRTYPIQLSSSRIRQPLGEHGTVYPTLRVAVAWGILTVTRDAPGPRSPCPRPPAWMRLP